MECGMFQSVLGEMNPAHSLKPSTDQHFGGSQIEQKDDRPLAELQQEAWVYGMELLEGGHGECFIPGNRLFATRDEAYDAMKHHLDHIPCYWVVKRGKIFPFHVGQRKLGPSPQQWSEWHPVVVEESADTISGIRLVPCSRVTRADGSHQWEEVPFADKVPRDHVFATQAQAEASLLSQ